MFTRPCPKCAFVVASDANDCPRCGVIFHKIRGASAPPSEPDRTLPTVRASEARPTQTTDLALRSLLKPDALYIEQFALHWWEILFNFEQRNEYQVCDEQGRMVGNIVEQGSGILQAVTRVFLGSHRPLDVMVFDATSSVVLQFKRTFFWFFSSLTVHGERNEVLGRVERRFGVINKTYDLVDNTGTKFAQVRSPIWRLWTFPVYRDEGDQELACIRKRWSGLAKEWFTDADRFQVDFGQHVWTDSQRAVVFAAALSIDFDFFENNNQR